MSAYRTLSAEDLEAVRLAAAADAVADCRPITAGIENSNWFVTLRRTGRDTAAVLTLIESTVASAGDDLAFFIALTDTLAAAGLPVPAAFTLHAGARTFRLQQRPALLVPQLPGNHADRASAAQCTAVGRMLARLHLAARACPSTRHAPDALWWPSAFAALAPSLLPEQRAALGAALATASGQFAQAGALPRGIIHGDLFRDNVLFVGAQVTAVLDFYHATEDLLAWDIAIALNDWTMIDGQPDSLRAQAFLAGYEEMRRLDDAERKLLPALRRAAAARFWLSRLIAGRRQGADAADIQRKDPEEMRAWLRALG